MLNNYLKVVFRIFRKEKVFSLINLFGLVIGFTCCLIIFLFVKNELGYDKFHSDGDRIYRVAAAYMREGRWEPYASNSWKTAELLKSNFGEIEELVRIRTRRDIVEYKETRISERRLATVDENFFKVFSFEWVAGNRDEALKGSNKVVITESVAEKYFGNEDPLGKVFQVNDDEFQLMVSGIIKDMPPNSHFHFDFLISGETSRAISPPSLFTNVGWDSQYLYIKASKGFDATAFEAMLPKFIDDHLSPLTSGNFMLFTQPLLDIHLKSNLGLEIEANGNINHLYIFSVIAIFTMLIACINYMNLATARSMKRAREVGMRKVLGAGKSHLINQFLSESFIMTFIAILLALGLTYLILPSFNAFSDKEIQASSLMGLEMITTLVVLLFTVSILAGLYPAFILSSFKPLNTIKGGYLNRSSGAILRKILVVLQFGISIGLIIATGITSKQLNFLRNKDLGINKELLVAVPMQTMDRGKLQTVKNDLMADASIKSVGTANMKLPGWISNSAYYEAEGVPVDEVARKSMKIIRIDPDFLSTVEAEFIDGRNFSKPYVSDIYKTVILNESAVNQLGWQGPVGKWLKVDRGNRLSVIGVVKDFHFESLHRKIPPTIFVLADDWLDWMYVKIQADDIPSSIDHIENVYTKFVTDRDFTYSFVDEDVNRQYMAEDKFMQIFIIFTLMAIVIACLGIFGLISFMAEKRSKEIGIRKVLGASVGGVTYLLIKEFVILLFFASVISWPFTYFFMNNWLQEFIYRTSINLELFLAATFLALAIAVLSTGFKALHAGLANPIKALKEE